MLALILKSYIFCCTGLYDDRWVVNQKTTHALYCKSTFILKQKKNVWLSHWNGIYGSHNYSLQGHSFFVAECPPNSCQTFTPPPTNEIWQLINSINIFFTNLQRIASQSTSDESTSDKIDTCNNLTPSKFLNNNLLVITDVVPSL